MTHPGEKSEKFKPHGIIATVVVFVCIAIITALGFVVAFMESDNPSFYKVLCAICVFFVVDAGASACIACMGPVNDKPREETNDCDEEYPPSIGTNIQRGKDPTAGGCKICCCCPFDDSLQSLYQNYLGAVIASFIVKFAGMFVSLMFATADLVQFLGQFRDLPDTKINKFMEALGSDVGGWKYAAIVACIACNVLFNDQFVATYLDKRTSAWGVVGLQVLYLIVENIDSYAALCFGNIS